MNRLREQLTKLNLHLLVLALLILIDLVLGIRVFLAQRAINADQSAAFTAREMQYGQLRARMQQIENLPQKVVQARNDANEFIEKRIAPNDSTIAAELGNLASTEGVQLTHAQYLLIPASDGLMEIQIDASLTGQYASLMHFINDLERDKNHVFFIITAIALNGQQGGLVNLRIRINTYMQNNPEPAPKSAQGTSQGQTPGTSQTSNSSSQAQNTSARLNVPQWGAAAWR